tara:strand:+ start:2343 stop:2720 length:378 start_codon:yes stop_codon:yes gene_type:complete
LSLLYYFLLKSLKILKGSFFIEYIKSKWGIINIMMYIEEIKREIFFRLKFENDFNLLNDIMMDLVNEGKVHHYYISKKINPTNIGIKNLRLTSNQGKDYTIGFNDNDINNIKSNYRDLTISNIIK